VADSLDARTLDVYAHEVAAELGLRASDVVCETGEYPCAEVRFAGRAPDRPPRDELLCWSSGEGWQIAVAEGPSGSFGVTATLPGIHPAPRVVGEFVKEVVASWAEQVVRRPEEDDGLTELLDRPFPRNRAKYPSP
jgi:hypothetical protein